MQKFSKLASLFLLASLPAAPHRVSAAATWGGSVGLTNDYVVRGVSRTDHDASVQADLYVISTSGFIAGAFASSVRFTHDTKRDTELGAFVGVVRTFGDDFRAKIQASHYDYPWSNAGARYNYDEFSVEWMFADSLSLTAIVSPNSPRYYSTRGLKNVAYHAIEIGAQTPAWHRLTLNAGYGRAHIGGPEGASYDYWSLGGSYGFTPLTLSVSWVDTSKATKTYYDAAARHRWVAALLFRF